LARALRIGVVSRGHAVVRRRLIHGPRLAVREVAPRHLDERLAAFHLRGGLDAVLWLPERRVLQSNET